jgi:hypothetical protein
MNGAFTEEQVVAALKQSDAADLANIPAVINSLVKVLAASLQCAEDAHTASGATTCLASKAASATTVLGETTGAPLFRAASFVVNQSASSIGLLSISQYTSPAKAATFVTLQMASKIVGVVELAQLDNCKTAIASLLVSTGTGALVCSGTLGIGCFASAIVIAAEGFNVYGQCRNTK